MAYQNGAYMKVWEINPQQSRSGKTMYKVRMSSSKKNASGTGYETDWSGTAYFVGKAAETAAAMQSGDKIKIGSCNVTTNKGNNGTWFTNYTVFECEIMSHASDNGGQAVQNTQTASVPAPNPTVENTGFLNVPDGVMEDLPFN